jgi:hypothetical protein
MSALTLSAAVAALRPGLSTSPEIALNSRTVIKEVSDTVYSLSKTDRTLTAITTGLLVTSLFATLIRARLPSIQTQQRNPEPTKRSLVEDAIKAVTSDYALFNLTLISVYGEPLFHLNRQYFQRLSKAVDLLQPGMTIPYDAALAHWNDIKFFAEKIPKSIAELQHHYMCMGITAALTTIASVQFIRSQALEGQPEQYSRAKLWLDRITVSGPGLATVLHLCAYAYARTYYHKLT